MAAFSSWVQTVTTTRKCWSLDIPTNATEMSKVLSSIHQFIETSGIEYYDDTVIVDADDEKIFFYVKMKENEKRQ